MLVRIFAEKVGKSTERVGGGSHALLRLRVRIIVIVDVRFAYARTEHFEFARNGGKVAHVFCRTLVNNFGSAPNFFLFARGRERIVCGERERNFIVGAIRIERISVFVVWIGAESAVFVHASHRIEITEVYRTFCYAETVPDFRDGDGEFYVDFYRVVRKQFADRNGQNILVLSDNFDLRFIAVHRDRGNFDSAVIHARVVRRKRQRFGNGRKPCAFAERRRVQMKTNFVENGIGSVYVVYRHIRG